MAERSINNLLIAGRGSRYFIILLVGFHSTGRRNVIVFINYILLWHKWQNLSLQQQRKLHFTSQWQMRNIWSEPSEFRCFSLWYLLQELRQVSSYRMSGRRLTPPPPHGKCQARKSSFVLPSEVISWLRPLQRHSPLLSCPGYGRIRGDIGAGRGKGQTRVP